MRIIVLASGSKGNITYLEYKETKILIDCGMNITYIKEKMQENNIEISELDAILLTHTHKDHIYGLNSLLKVKQIPVYVLEDMIEEIGVEEAIIYEDNNNIKDIEFKVLKTSHDKSSVGFLFELEKEVVYITDTGYLKRSILEKIKNKSIYIMESNHDVEMLMNGNYPHFLKRRILSDKGHLSNDASLNYLKKIIGEKTETIVLAHLSESNNCPKKVKEIFSSEIKQIKIHVAEQREALALEI